MGQALSWIADAVLVLMLAGTLVMAVRLDRALRIVGRDRNAFETLISDLDTATNAVKLGIQALRAEADRAAGQVGRRSEEADKMATDLSFLIEAADRAGARLEQRLASAPRSTGEDGRPVAAARKLVDSERSVRKRKTKTTIPAVVTTPGAVDSPETVQAASPTTLTEVEIVPSSTNTPAALRALAGITTRKRAMERDETPAGRTDLDRVGRAGSLAGTGDGTSHIKLVG